jgi:AcrR family transcriptional regulator
MTDDLPKRLRALRGHGELNAALGEYADEIERMLEQIKDEQLEARAEAEHADRASQKAIAALFAGGGWDTWMDAMDGAEMLIDDARRKARRKRWWWRLRHWLCS